MVGIRTGYKPTPSSLTAVGSGSLQRLYIGDESGSKAFPTPATTQPKLGVYGARVDQDGTALHAECLITLTANMNESSVGINALAVGTMPGGVTNSGSYIGVNALAQRATGDLGTVNKIVGLSASVGGFFADAGAVTNEAIGVEIQNLFAAGTYGNTYGIKLGAAFGGATITGQQWAMALLGDIPSAVAGTMVIGDGVGTTKAPLGVALEVNSAGGTRMFIPPKMTTAQRVAFTAVSSPPAIEGMHCWDTDLKTGYKWDGVAWVAY